MDRATGSVDASRGTPRVPMWLPVAAVLAYFAAMYAVAGGVTGDHLMFGGTVLILFYVGRWGRYLLAFLLPFILTGVLYDLQLYVGEALRARIWIREPYELERLLFGIATSRGELTPTEWWADHLHPALDLLAGFAYLVFVFAFMAIAAYLLIRGLRAARCAGRGSMAWAVPWSFLVVNILGYITWFALPVAPPWYVESYGFEIVAGVMNDPARAVRFDALFGTDFFGAAYGKGTNAFGAMPSLHVAYPTLAAYFAFRHGAARTVSLVFLAVMAFSAVYLNHHYVIDVLAGVGYGLVAGVLTEWLFRGLPLDDDGRAGSPALAESPRDRVQETP